MTENPKPTRFAIKHLPSLLLETAKAWNKDDPWRLSAVVAYYALLSLPGLLIIIINTVGLIWGPDIVAGRLTGQISSVIGQSAADAVQSIFANAVNGDTGMFATVLGVASLLFGATGVFYHLQLSINSIWEIKQKPKSNFLRMLLDRVVSFGFVLIVGFLLLTSFVISALLGILNEFIRGSLPEFAVYLAYGLNIVMSLGIISVLFALIFKYLPDAYIRWRSVWIGAVITSVLFTLGKELLGLYFGEANPGSTYGAAGSLVLILLWVSYSCLILFFGAEFSWVYAQRYGHAIKPKEHAVLVKIEEVVTEKPKQQIG
jgi:membrane protein